jgi:hypothetical protein
MKKLNAPKKLTLSRETVGLLEEGKLGWVAGDGPMTRTLCGVSGCPNSCLC